MANQKTGPTAPSIDWMADIIPLTGRDATGEATAKSTAKGRVLGAVVTLRADGKAPMDAIVFRQGGDWLAYPALGVDKPVRPGELYGRMVAACKEANAQGVRVFRHAEKGTVHALVLIHPYETHLDGSKASPHGAVTLPVLPFLAAKK